MIRRPTTERVTPESWALRVTYWQSLAAYRWASQLATGASVLDIGCGEGYGTAELARTARLVIGLDLDLPTLEHARRRYPAANLTWVRASAERLPFRAASFQLICCFQVLEHLPDPERLLREARRVLVPGGHLILTTPNRPAVFSGLNPHHAREYDEASLRALVTTIFPRVDLLGVFPSTRVLAYRTANRRLVERILRLDRFGLHRHLPTELRAFLHAVGTLAVRHWLNQRQRELVTTIGIDDFRIAAGDLAQAIDLVAIARDERDE